MAKYVVTGWKIAGGGICIEGKDGVLTKYCNGDTVELDKDLAEKYEGKIKPVAKAEKKTVEPDAGSD